MSRYIVESIKDFIKQNETDYAIMLNGTWGSGKTYFWKNCLRGEIEKISNAENKKYKTVSISLYGLTSIMDVEKKILLSLYLNKNMIKPLNNKKLIKWSSTVLSGLKDLEFMGISLKSFDRENMDIQELIDLKDVVFCFDDLERSNIVISDVLGYINKLLENGNAKVIIIANENEIDEMEYNKIKEKVIGRTLLYSPNHTEVVKLLIDIVKNEKCKQVLRENMHLIEAVFLSSSTNNIRILKQTIMDFEMIYSKIQESYNDLNEQIITDVLNCTLAISFEIRSGANGSDILESIKSNQEFSHIIHLMEKEDANRWSYLKLLEDKYATENQKLIFFKFIEIFIRKSIFDMQLCKDEINEMQKSIDNHDLECSEFINSEYWKYSDEEFDRLSVLTYEKILNGEINLYNYYAAYKCYEKLINHKLMDMSTDKLKDDILAGLEKSKTNAYLNEMIVGGLKLDSNSGDNETHISIVHRTNLIIDELKLEKERKDIIELFQLVKGDIHEFVDIMKTDKQSVPIFNLLDDELFINTILQLENRNLYFYNELLKTRYVMPIRKELVPELKVLKTLRIIIEENLKEKPVTPKSILLRELSDFIDLLKVNMS
ncbi:P-loop NTPase fold protein [Bacillus cereus]|uniref:P-loop NTPase fold protein n=1 Tax=Bacillus cereus TaxID=1396 RepID=UPI0025A1B491|nr:P-loop NTPase fold protein [Bacillus cereus]MDM5235317.1 P-loop NTPase fold protein [Bacillus cereus]